MNAFFLFFCREKISSNKSATMIRSNCTSNTIKLTDLSAEVLDHGADSYRYPRRKKKDKEI